jgi:uncharacterized membrane protein
MTIENIDLMRKSREALEGKWGLAIGTFLVFTVITSIPGYKITRIYRIINHWRTFFVRSSHVFIIHVSWKRSKTGADI